MRTRPGGLNIIPDRKLMVASIKDQHSRVHAAADVDCVAPLVACPVPQEVQDVSVVVPAFHVFAAQTVQVAPFI